MEVKTFMYEISDLELTRRMRIYSYRGGITHFPTDQAFVQVSVPGKAHARIIIGKNLDIPCVSRSASDRQEETKHIGYLLGLQVEEPAASEVGYQAALQEALLTTLEIKVAAIRYLGIFSSRTKKLTKV
jgi:hypothetical protein